MPQAAWAVCSQPGRPAQGPTRPKAESELMTTGFWVAAEIVSARVPFSPVVQVEVLDDDVGGSPHKGPQTAFPDEDAKSKVSPVLPALKAK